MSHHHSAFINRDKPLRSNFSQAAVLTAFEEATKEQNGRLDKIALQHFIDKYFAEPGRYEGLYIVVSKFWDTKKGPSKYSLTYLSKFSLLLNIPLKEVVPWLERDNSCLDIQHKL